MPFIAYVIRGRSLSWALEMRCYIGLLATDVFARWVTIRVAMVIVDGTNGFHLKDSNPTCDSPPDARLTL